MKANGSDYRSRGKALLENPITGEAYSTGWEWPTPDEAARVLAEANTANRHLVETRACSHAGEMLGGTWQATHQGVAFDAKGILVDGQKRYRAIVLSGKAQWLMVTRGLLPGVIEVIDRHQARSLADTLRIMGYEHSSTSMVSLARAMMAGPGYDRRVPDTLLRRFVDANLEALVFAHGTGLARASGTRIAAAIAPNTGTCSSARIRSRATCSLILPLISSNRSPDRTSTAGAFDDRDAWASTAPGAGAGEVLPAEPALLPPPAAEPPASSIRNLIVAASTDRPPKKQPGKAR